MSENVEQTAPVAETKEPVVAGEPKGNGEDKPDGTQSVVFTPEQEARFKRIYGNMKQYERINNSLIEQNRILLEKFEKLETDTKQKTWNELREEKRKALEAGEAGRVVDIDDKLAELREAPKEKAPPARTAPPPSVFSPEQEEDIRAWSSELTNDGNWKRPWAQPSHPLHMKFANLAAGVMNDPRYSSKGVRPVLDEANRLMNSQQQSAVRPSAQVLSQNQDIRRTPLKASELTADQKFVALRMYPKLKEDEAFGRYSEAVAKAPRRA